MELLKQSTVYLNNRKEGGTIGVPKVFFDSNNLKDNRDIDIYSDTLEDGRKALIIIPKIQTNSSQIQNQNN